MAQYHPKTLAKTLSYIACYAPDEYGLFWDEDGTLPWKELYWALQEDDSLRFVREAHLREIEYLGLPLPFSIEGSVLRLKESRSIEYPIFDPPDRLFFACRRKQHAVVVRYGLEASRSGRDFLPLAGTKELALRIGKRRDPQPVLIECISKKALQAGIHFRKAGGDLYLVKSLAPEHLICPPVRDEDLSRPKGSRKGKAKSDGKEHAPATPGSFIIDPSAFLETSPEKGRDKTKGKDRKARDWKRESRKDRHKRSI